MKKRITTLMIVAMVMSLLTACGDEKTSSTQRSRRNESTLTEQTLVEEIITEDIEVEEIEVHEIEVREIGWGDNCTYWDDV